MPKITSNAQVFDVDVFKTSTERLNELGALAIDKNGNCYRYVKAGATNIVVGKLQNAPASVAHHENLTVATAAAGSTSLTVTLGATAVTANQYAGGKITIVAGTGVGYTYTIASHPAADGAATLVVTLDSAESVQVATNVSDSKATLTPNAYNGIILHESGTEDSYSVGVSIMPITAGEYGWLLTKGAVAVLNGTNAPVIGRAVIASETIDGAVDTETSTGTDANRVGVGIVTGSATQYRPVFINLEK
jgi:hypothetical protein